ncbi:MAG: hypothetical protein LQ346_007702, partial [Caloplaca aetnensis]
MLCQQSHCLITREASSEQTLFIFIYVATTTRKKLKLETFRHQSVASAFSLTNDSANSSSKTPRLSYKMDLAVVPQTILANLPALALAALPILALTALPELALAILPEWASAIFPGRASTNSPPELPPSVEDFAAISMLGEFKSKLSDLEKRTAPLNHAINVRLRDHWYFLEAGYPDSDFHDRVATWGLRPYWKLFGRLIEKWLIEDSEISQQSEIYQQGNILRQAEEGHRLHREVMAFKGVHTSREDGELRVLGTTDEGRELARSIGFDSEGRCA